MNAPVDIDHDSLARSRPLDKLDVSDPALYRDDVWMPYFRRLRREEPVHWTAESMFWPHWSVTKNKNNNKAELAHKTLSSESSRGGITIRDRPADLRLPMFIAMD